jgi:hypothetical protein
MLYSINKNIDKIVSPYPYKTIRLGFDARKIEASGP